MSFKVARYKRYVKRFFLLLISIVILASIGGVGYMTKLHYNDPQWWQALAGTTAVGLAVLAVFKTLPDNLKMKRQELKDQVYLQIYEAFRHHQVNIVEYSAVLEGSIISIKYPYKKLAAKQKVTDAQWERHYTGINETYGKWEDAISLFWTDGLTQLLTIPDLYNKHDEITDTFIQLQPKVKEWVSKCPKATPSSAAELKKLNDTSKVIGDQIGSFSDDIIDFMRELHNQMIEPILTS